MPKNDNAHALRLGASLRKNGAESAAREIEQRFPLSKGAGIEQKFTWAKSVCDYLEQSFNRQQLVQIRKECRCNDGKSIANKMKKYWNQAQTTRDFVEAFNQKETFASLRYVSDRKILFCYPQCYCACVKRVDGVLPQSWCACTLGNAEGIFRELLGTSRVQVALLESIKTGGTQCVIQVEW